jgi:hypothetical protein
MDMSALWLLLLVRVERVDAVGGKSVEVGGGVGADEPVRDVEAAVLPDPTADTDETALDKDESEGTIVTDTESVRSIEADFA